MKTYFETPEMEIVKFSVEDIITTSDTPSLDKDETPPPPGGGF